MLLLTVPLLFQPNLGQLDPSVQFFARSSNAQYFATARGVRVGLQGGAVQLEWPGARPLRFIAEQQQPARMSWFMGSDATRWRTNVPTFAALRSRDLYPGVDLVLYSQGDRFEYDLELAPHVDVSAVRLGFRGAKKVRLDSNGDLVLTVAGRELHQRPPQVRQGGREVAARYVRRGAEWGLALGVYDTTVALRIDPVLDTLTYFGGSASDSGAAVAVDAQGNIFITGRATSPDLPTLGAPPSSLQFPPDIYIAKFDSTARTLLYSTYFGGGSEDLPSGLAVTPAGEAVATGFTHSSDLPILNAAQPTIGQFYDGFVVKLDPVGNLVFSTFLGGDNDDYATAAAIDSAGRIFVTGCTTSPDFPTANTTQTTHGQGQCDAFLTLFPPNGGPFVFSRMLGSPAYAWGFALTLDASGNPYVAGHAYLTVSVTTASLPSLVGPELDGGEDGFVLRYDPSGTLIFSRFIGGSGDDTITGIAADGDQGVVIVGSTGSPNFPLVNAFQGCAADGDGGIDNGFVARLDATGNTLTTSSCLFAGGGAANAVAVDDAGYAYVTGLTHAANAATLDGVQTSLGGADDAFLFRVGTDGQRTYGTYLGGSSEDNGVAIAMGLPGIVVVVGDTVSTDFPAALSQRGQYASDTGGTNAFLAAFTFPEAILDAGQPDAGVSDAGATDAGALDSGLNDAGQPDSGLVADAGQKDAGVVDSGVSDAGPSTPGETNDRVGCGCSSADPAFFLLAGAGLCLLSRRRAVRIASRCALRSVLLEGSDDSHARHASALRSLRRLARRQPPGRPLDARDAGVSAAGVCAGRRPFPRRVLPARFHRLWRAVAQRERIHRECAAAARHADRLRGHSPVHRCVHRRLHRRRREPVDQQ